MPRLNSFRIPRSHFFFSHVVNVAGYSAFTAERNEFSQLTRDCKMVVGLYFAKNAFF